MIRIRALQPSDSTDALTAPTDRACARLGAMGLDDTAVDPTAENTALQPHRSAPMQRRETQDPFR